MTDPELQRLYEAIKGTNRFKSDPSLRGMTAALVKLGKISDTASAGDVRQSEGHDSRKAAADSAAEDAWIKTRADRATAPRAGGGKTRGFGPGVVGRRGDGESRPGHRNRDRSFYSRKQVPLARRWS